MRTAIYAGSFDPPTNGHLNVIEKALGLFDKLIIAIGDNPSKTSYFTHTERIEMLKEITSNLPNIECEIEIDSFKRKFLVDYAREKDAKYIVRGIRDSKNFREERIIFLFNKNRDPIIEPIFVMPDRSVADISSSLVKSLIGYTNWREETIKLVPYFVHERLLKKQFENEYRGTVKGLEKYNIKISENEIKDTLKFLNMTYGVHIRPYHNINHILHMLELANNLVLDDFDMDNNILKYAIIFHDCIDEADNKDGVLESAKVSKKLLNQEWVANLVENIIMATDYSNNAKKEYFAPSKYQKIIMDLDFSQMGYSYKIYSDNTKKIRDEYDHVTDEEWTKGRYNFLNMMLVKEKIFLTDEFKHLEKKAAENILREMKEMETRLVIFNDEKQ